MKAMRKTKTCWVREYSDYRLGSDSGAATVYWLRSDVTRLLGDEAALTPTTPIVRKGEHGLMIWAPTKPRKEDPGRQEGEVSTKPDFNFIPVTVFDVSQTEELSQ